MKSRHVATLLLLLGCTASQITGEDPVVTAADAGPVEQLLAPDGAVAEVIPDAAVAAPEPVDAAVTPPRIDAPPPDAPPPPPPKPDAPPPKPDAAPPPKPDAAPAVWSNREKCENMCQSYCVHRYMCDGTPVDVCRMAIDENDGGTCAERAYLFKDISQEKVQACIDAIEAMSCPDFLRMFNTGSGVPTVCLGILYR